MYIKLVNPVNEGTLTFKIGNEIRTEILRDLDEAYIDAYQEKLGKPVTLDGQVLPTDNRRFSVWIKPKDPARKYSYLVIEVPCIHWNGQQLVIFTNWHAYLMSDTGQTIDRLFTNTEVGP